MKQRGEKKKGRGDTANGKGKKKKGKKTKPRHHGKWQYPKGEGFHGIRFYDDKRRRHGAVREDRYFSIRHRVGGKTIEEGLGWSSRGMTLKKAKNMLAELEENKRRGEPPFSLKERRALENEKRELERLEKEKAEREAVTFAEFFETSYFPAQTEKTKKTLERERSLYKKWIGPAIGSLALREISEIALEGLKQKMMKAGQAPRSAQYALAICRQVLRRAYKKKLIVEVPVAEMPKVENERTGFLYPEQAKALLTALEKYRDLHAMTAIGIYCGLRFGEIAALRWSDLNLEGKTIRVRRTTTKTKAGARLVPIPAPVLPILSGRPKGDQNDLVFVNRKGEKYDRVSNSFRKTVEALELNKGRERLDRICFHSTRHTTGTTLYNKTRDLYAVQRVLGHGLLSQSARYSKTTEETLQDYGRAIEEGLEVKEPKAEVISLNEKK
ncbi:MAG TPA: tyrosine-type recombinase/integrase [Syntrophales bacterium]|nr:tyrosine-type recombinase/integrase [Syntrophales bacterium]